MSYFLLFGFSFYGMTGVFRGSFIELTFFGTMLLLMFAVGDVVMVHAAFLHILVGSLLFGNLRFSPLAL